MISSIQRPALTLAAAALVLTGCADMNLGGMTDTQRRTAIGAGVGAVAGTAIGRDAQGALIGAGVGALGGYIWSKHMEEKKQAMERATAGTGVAVSQTPDNQLKVNIPSDVSFDTGSAVIKPNMRAVLDQFASGLQPNSDVRIIGHTDSTGSDELNDRLSLQRAEAARNYLASRGVDPGRIAIAGRGKREPIADNNTDAGRAANRRVELFLGERVATR